ncbi:amino acid permease [Mucilaginibacter ginkgonis]|uniref:Amino acid permease n=1 Tax=Mucilaginibacter ginkgonis TaxID=2682091 RepID=A0A6I4I5N6_9SPHI|nr:amino acid permease [Mucilaginibacter ginkgonis]QQL48488.1 amino acid permease [Mucilaginibacter ginkgonis]
MSDNVFRKKSIEKILQDAEQGFSDAEHTGPNALRRSLKVKDLTFLGIAAVIGTGVFTAIGSASYHGGPAVTLLFLFTAIACGFAAFCYAEFASAVPVAGSAYTYSYIAFGEIFAWIIGWDLLMEYAIGNIAVAISWSQYFVRVLAGFGVHLPGWLTMDYVSAHTGYLHAQEAISKGGSPAKLDAGMKYAYDAWTTAPGGDSIKLIMNFPALLIVAIISYIVYIGIRESKRANNIMVITKLGIIVVVIIAGAFYVDPGNWSNFMPNGFSGVMKGVSAVFFAYIGFDAISTTAEECENPQRDLPKAMFNTLFICTGLYIVLVLVLTGMSHYTKLNVADPLAFVFEDQHSKAATWVAGVISVSAIVVIASVLLVYQLGQPRIWMSMSRDGLLPKIFSRIHPKYHTPSFSTVVTGLVVAIPALFLNLDVVLALTSIGTLFAFVLVCGGVLMLNSDKKNDQYAKFKVPYVNGKYIVPLAFIIILGCILKFAPGYFTQLMTSEGVPMIIFLVVAIVVTILTFVKSYSLIPVLGLLSCFYLMAQESATNWARFVIWLVIGLVIYFFYGFKNSKLSGRI